MKSNNKGQVTIFIIVAVLIVVGVVLFFVLRGQIGVERPTDVGGREFIRSCVSDSLEESIGEILRNGGRIEPAQTISYYGEDYNYLCYQEDYYHGCYNTHPDLLGIVEEEIFEDTSGAVQDCFDFLKEDYQDKNYEVSGGSTDYSISLVPGKIEVNLKKEISVSKGDSGQDFLDFDFSVLSSLYDLVETSANIVNGESQFCNFEYVGYMILYPRFDIRKVDFEKSKIYWVMNRETGEEFRFAVRSCAFPPGI